MAEKNQYLKMRCWILKKALNANTKEILVARWKEIDSVVKESLMEKSMRKKI
jgi:hypothetical protein